MDQYLDILLKALSSTFIHTKCYIDMNQLIYEDKTVLMLLCKYRNDEFMIQSVKTIQKKNVKVKFNVQNLKGKTALHYASKHVYL